MKTLSPWFVVFVAFGCGGAQPAPEEAPVRVAAVEAPGKTAEAQPTSTAKATDTERAEAIAKALSELEVVTFGALGSGDTAGILSVGDIPEGMLDEAAASAPGVDSVARQGGGGGGRVGSGAVAPGGQLTGLYTVGRTQFGPVSVSKGTLSDPDGQVARHRRLFAACYREARRGNPTHRGALAVELDVNGAGGVTSVRTKTQQGLAASVARCVEAGATGLRFDAPSSEVTLSFLVTFDP